MLVSAVLNKCEGALEGLFFEKDFCKRILINSKKGMISRIMMPFCYFLKVVSSNCMFNVVNSQLRGRKRF